MMKYLIIQFKRWLRVIPILALVFLLLLAGAGAVYHGIGQSRQEDDRVVKLGFVGVAEDSMLEMAVSAITTMDSSRFTLQLENMTASQAHAQLARGDIAGYIVFPEQFLENALHGNIQPLGFYSAQSGADLISLVRDELTVALADVLMTSEYGAFALGELLSQYGYAHLVADKMNEIAVHFAGMILSRENFYTVTEYGAAGGVDIATYMTAGLTVCVMFFAMTPAVGVLTRGDMSLEKMLRPKAFGAVKQVLCEFFAFYAVHAALFILAGCILLGLDVGALLIVIFPICAITYLLLGFTKDVIGGALAVLISGLGLCLAGGCIYPVYFLPASLQKASGWLPSALARDYLIRCLVDGSAFSLCLTLFLIGTACLCAASAWRWVRLRTTGG